MLRFLAGFQTQTDARFAEALEQMRAAGAEIVEITAPPADLDALGNDELTILLAELKTDMDAYLASTPPAAAPTLQARLPGRASATRRRS